MGFFGEEIAEYCEYLLDFRNTKKHTSASWRVRNFVIALKWLNIGDIKSGRFVIRLVRIWI